MFLGLNIRILEFHFLNTVEVLLCIQIYRSEHLRNCITKDTKALLHKDCIVVLLDKKMLALHYFLICILPSGVLVLFCLPKLLPCLSSDQHEKCMMYMLQNVCVYI